MWYFLSRLIVTPKSGRALRSRRPAPYHYRPIVERLEDRTLLTMFPVTTTADSGMGSLRQAILNANANMGADSIVFHIPASGVQTIAPLSALPMVTDAVTIDGTTQTFPLVVLDGINAGAGVNGLVLAAPSISVKGLVIDSFSLNGILLGATQDLVQGKLIGIDVTGSMAKGNANGIVVENGIHRIQNNVISGNLGAGIAVSSGATLISGNVIGTDKTGTNAVGNGGYGISIGSSGNLILNNVISGNVMLGGVLLKG